MDPRNMPIGGVFADSRRLIVPIYQRTYEWTPDRQIEGLFDHIEAKANARLANEPARFFHYMGALLLIPRSSFVFGRIPVLDIVDGQQRITTFQIALAALRDLAVERGEQSIADQIRPLLFNLDESSMQDPKSDRFKLEPTRLDRSMFRDLLTKSIEQLRADYALHFTQAGKLRKDGMAPKPLAAWWHIRNRAIEFVDEEGGDPSKRLRALLEAMLQDLHLIVITLAETDDAQVIFETLNFGGEPLAAMDLVRNDVFHRAAKNGEDIEDLMDTGWAMFETPFWKEQTTQGRITKPRMDFFLAHALAAETGKETLLNELYAAYKRFAAARHYSSVDAELQTLRKHAPTYQALVTPESGPLARLARALEVFDISTAYPLVLALNSATTDADARATIYRLIESYVVRRALCGLTPKNYNIVFLRLATVARDSNGSPEALRAAFGEYSLPSNIFPSDADLRQAIGTRPIYGAIPQRRLRYILRELELGSRDEYNEAEGLRDDLEIEHILPGSWYEHWPLPDGSRVAREQPGLSEEQRVMIERRESLLNTLGNLTLLTKPANLEVLHYAFNPEKKARLRASLLRINQDIAVEDEWNEDAIGRRAVRLANVAIRRIWPQPLGDGSEAIVRARTGS